VLIAMAVHKEVITTRSLMQTAACVFLVLLGMGKPVSCRFDTVVILNDMPGEVSSDSLSLCR